MITIFYATQTGNAEECAEWLGENLQNRGLICRTVNLADYDAGKLREENIALFVVSTFGEGDPPDDAVSFYEGLNALKPDDLAGLSYAVFALGDIDYVLFCGFGNTCDRLLDEAGAERLLEIEECNLDQAERLPSWVEKPELAPTKQSCQ